MKPFKNLIDLIDRFTMSFGLYIYYSLAVYHVYTCLIGPKKSNFLCVVFYTFVVSRMVKLLVIIYYLKLKKLKIKKLKSQF